MNHPIQPIITDEHGTKRFKDNKIVRYLLDASEIDMNQLAAIPFDQDDREQFAQLIGYSVSGFSDLSYVRDITYETAVKMSEDGKSELETRIEVLESKLDAVRNAIRSIAPKLFRIHPDDLVD